MKYKMHPSSMPITLLALFISVASSHAAILKGPYLQDVTPSSIRVFWETDTGSDSRVDYGSTASYGSFAEGNYSTQLSTGTYLHDVPLTGLTADTIYHYKVTTGGFFSDDHTFPTAIAPDTSFFRFAFYGDTQTGDRGPSEDNVQMIAEGILNSNPMFVIFTGDAVFRGNIYSMWEPQFFEPSASLFYSVPLFFAVGNHELGDPFWTATFFYWPYNPGTWYSFDYGNAHFTVMDTDADFSPGSAQYEWLVGDLAAASKTWLFVSFHHPPYSASPEEDQLITAAVGQFLVPLFETYGVDMVLNGHVHLYERSEKNGIYYITSGGGGAKLNTTQDTINPYQQYWASTYHFCTVDVSTEELLFKARYADGTPFDEVYVGHPPMLRMTVNPYPTSIGNRIAIEASAQPTNNTFDALAVILFPDGRVYSMLPRKGLRQGAIPLAQNVHSLAAATDITLLSTVIPHGVSVGSYTVAAGLFPHGTVPRSLADAQAKAFPGYFSSETIQINQ